MILERWNPKTHEYEDFEVPDGRKVRCTALIMEELIDCVSCGLTLPYKEMFTSIEIHTQHGFGYSVCPDCYEEEQRRNRDV